MEEELAHEGVLIHVQVLGAPDRGSRLHVWRLEALCLQMYQSLLYCDCDQSFAFWTRDETTYFEIEDSSLGHSEEKLKIGDNGEGVTLFLKEHLLN